MSYDGLKIPKASDYINGLGSLPKDYSLPGNMESIYADSDWRSYMPTIGEKAVDEFRALPIADTDNSMLTGLGGSLTNGIDWLGKNKEGIGTGLGMLSFGLGAYSDLFGQGKKMYDKNMRLLDQRIADNSEKMARRKALNEAYAKHL